MVGIELRGGCSADEFRVLARKLPDVESELIKEFYERHYRETLDQPISMLGNKSPCDAAKTPCGREKVVAWLKHLETGEAKTRQNKSTDAYDFSWIWQELGVQELRE